RPAGGGERGTRRGSGGRPGLRPRAPRQGPVLRPRGPARPGRRAPPPRRPRGPMTVSRRTWIAVLAGGIAATAVGLVFAGRKPGVEAPAGQEDPGPEPGGPWFVDVTRQAGIDFVHFDPTTDSHYIQETMGSGLAWIDYDNDGWPDLFCVQAAPVRP